MRFARVLISPLYRLLARWLEARGLAQVALSAWRQAALGGGNDSNFQLARRLLDQGKAAESLPYLLRVLSAVPGDIPAQVALGAAYRLQGDLEQAHEVWRAGLDNVPNSAQLLCNLGELALVRGNAAEAMEYLQKAHDIAPHLLEVHANRVTALFELARLDEARIAAEEAIARFPEVAGLQVNYGNVLLHSGKGRLAVKAFRAALELDLGCAEAHMNLGLLFGEQRHQAGALDFIVREIAVKGESVQRLASLALAQFAKKDFTAAEDTCKRIMTMQPGNLSALTTLAGCLSHRGDHRGAIDMHQRALAISPGMSGIASNIAFESTYLEGVSPEEIHEHHLQWARQYEIPQRARCYSHFPPVEEPLRLKVGYVSGDIGYHPVGYLLRDVIAHHDTCHFEVHCFSMMRQQDDIAVAVKEKAEHWHDVLLDSDDEFAKQVHEMGIHILVDLSGHTAYNRLPAFVLKPAPVSATWIGYFHSTGLESIDYFITDPLTSPRGCPQLFSEVPVWLPHSRFCYSPPAYAAAVAPAPALANGYVTFGCFNRLDKLVPEVITNWARVLMALPDSRLLLKAHAFIDEQVVSRINQAFLTHGVAPHRLELRSGSSHQAMLMEYGDMDIALDPFPFNGGMTTLEALWMGVPVVTLAGTGIVSRQSVAMLANLGLAEQLAFSDVDAYVAGAVALAQDMEGLQQLRQRIRPLMQASPLCRPDKFTRDLEALYQRMWQAYCHGERLASDV